MSSGHSGDPTNYHQALSLLARSVEEQPRQSGYPLADAALQVQRAQVHATLALVDVLEELVQSTAKTLRRS